ncbi:MAG: hypothetical protein ACYCW6_07140 [Candidatus Xenobia bacterium]
MRRFVGFGLILLTAFCPRMVLADDARQSIQAAYDKMSHAAGLKFVDGMLEARTPEFVAYNRNHEKLAAPNQRAQLQALVRSALQITETTQIVSFHQNDAKHAMCDVHDLMRVVLVDRQTREPVTVAIDSRSTDSWIKTSQGWRESSSTLLQQQTSRVPAAP